MNRSVVARHVLPATVLVLVTVLDVVLGRGQVVLGLLVIAPLLAASVLDRRWTTVYAVLALVGAALLGMYDQQYTAATSLTQAIRLLGVAAGGVAAVIACTLRLRREADLDRLAGEAATARTVLQLAETLQRSMLTEPPRADRLEMAVRYLPAVRQAQVGGDWYDAFEGPDGSMTLVIGDVAGHDGSAAATMAQARGLLRGISQTLAGSPAAVLDALDRALENLRMRTLITLTLATVHLDPADGPALLRWSNAGHPPPVVVRAGGATELLARRPDRLLGFGADACRSDHEVSLAPGDTVVFYTDGLVERRGVPIDDGIAWLVRELARHGARPLEELCDCVLAGLAGGVDDDVAVLAVRVRDRAVVGHPAPP